jgi:transcriptional regulator with PAS, ATPase and Fis domain
MKPTIVGVSNNISRIKELIDQVADTGLNTIVYGETGVGKELVVQNLYQKSTRVGKPFVKVNCAALPDTLLESEMFGYEQGAFTGADRRKRGKFEQANGGLLFLDEIGDMSLPLQAKLLHVLQGGDFSPLGSEKTVKMGAWVIAATNHELEGDMANGDFREDLYYRLSTIKIHIEPLRSRPEDIPYLIEHYVKTYTDQFEGKDNIRELQNVLKRLMILGNGEDNLDDMLMGNLNQPRTAVLPGAVAASATPMEILGFDSSSPPDLASLSLKKIKKKAMDRVEKEVISYVLEKTGWNRSKATKILKISYKTLLYKIKDLGIVPPEGSQE